MAMKSSDEIEDLKRKIENYTDMDLFSPGF